ncbi:unnamed protein product [Acanthoscelides obtectus]|uniref:Uncharacterized protein n=1 Tax=Acanthoscelides obtectus TaxID=200917 RepID=A0A9P0LXC5_ACAOB|nr:unnamed protein product [Acanthoscelides obtectus]CAK1668566.1 hypothetical protein AOBTE_LOCUS26488 [Acanthoscelides obtectus]
MNNYVFTTAVEKAEPKQTFSDCYKKIERIFRIETA